MQQRRIEIGVPTRNRIHCLLLLLQALRAQTYQLWDITIVDDGDPEPLRGDVLVQRMLWLLEQEGHRWRVIRGRRAGCHYAQNIILCSAEHDLVLRIDDDLVPEPSFLERLLATYVELSRHRPIGAVGGSYPRPHSSRRSDHEMTPSVRAAHSQYSPFESVEQRFLDERKDQAEPRQVPALYSSYLYDREAMLRGGGFPLAYSRRGEKEDTDSSLRLVMQGLSAVFEPRAVAWHLEAPSGGSRFSAAEMQVWLQHDVELFVKRLQALSAGSFDWEAERRANLEPYESLSEVRHSPSGFYGY